MAIATATITLLVLGGAAILAGGIGAGVAYGQSEAAKKSAEATILSSENNKIGTIESARLQALAQQHISDNEFNTAGADRSLREHQEKADLQQSDRWFSMIDNLQAEDLDEMVVSDRRSQNMRFDLRGRRSPNPIVNLDS